MTDEERQSIIDEEEVLQFFSTQKYFLKERLDEDKSGHRPDFLLEKSNHRYQIICEVKSIFSAGVDSQGNQASMYYRQSGQVYGLDPSRKIYEKLAVARKQVEELKRDRANLENLPFLVIFKDHAFFGDSELRYIEDNLRGEFPGISAIGSFVSDYDRKRRWTGFTLDQMRKYISILANRDPIPSVLQLKILLNRGAIVVFKSQHLPGQVYF